MQLRIKIQKVLDPRKVTPFEGAIIAAYDSSPNTQEGIIAVIETTKVAVKNNEQILPNATTLNLIFSCLLASDDGAYLEIKKNFMILAELTRLEEAQIEDMSVLLEAFNDKELHH